MAPNFVHPEDLEIFLEEAHEQFELLNEDIGRLESGADDAELLRQMFRSAHALKGSSGMLGFRMFSELSHAMEEALDRVRSGSLNVSADLIAQLTECLVALKAIRDKVQASGEDDYEIAALVESLRGAPIPQAEVAAAGLAGSFDQALAGDADASRRLYSGLAAGQTAFTIQTTTDQDGARASVRALQVISELSDQSMIICSIPSEQEIEAETGGAQLRVLLTTFEDAATIRRAALAIQDIYVTGVDPWHAASETSAANAAQKEAS